MDDSLEFWSEVRRAILDLVEKSGSCLDESSVEAVKHYLNHDEYEMAFEGLLIDLMERGCGLNDVEWCRYIDIGKKMGLDKESVFDSAFWGKFSDFVRAEASRGPL